MSNVTSPAPVPGTLVLLSASVTLTVLFASHEWNHMVQVIMVCLILLSCFDRSFLVSVIGDWRFLDHWFASSVLGLHTRDGGPG